MNETELFVVCKKSPCVPPVNTVLGLLPPIKIAPQP